MARTWTMPERMHASREATKRSVARELMLVSLLSRELKGSHLCRPNRFQKNFPMLVCLHTVAGPLVWRLSHDELLLFAHLTIEDNHARVMSRGDKDAVLLTLASLEEHK